MGEIDCREIVHGEGAALKESVDSETSQGAFRKMAVCVKCDIEDGHLNSLL